MHIAGRIFGDAPTGDHQDFSDLGRRVTTLIREHADEVRFVARGAIDGEPDGVAMFDAFMAISLGSFQDLAEHDVLDPTLDLEWAALHIVVFNLAVVLFQNAIENHLPEPLSGEAGMERWHKADTELFRHGYLRAEERHLPVSS